MLISQGSPTTQLTEAELHAWDQRQEMKLLADLIAVPEDVATTVQMQP